MPEALAVLVVLVVAVVAWFGAWLHARDPANYNAREEAARWQQQAGWLEQRLAVARRERWGEEMESGIARELENAREQAAVAAETKM